MMRGFDFDPWGFFVAVVIIILFAAAMLYVAGVMFPDVPWKWW